jgi:pimeloyl-ACP methyl ester carboxylesterase
VPTIVLVHGSFAESASWNGVIDPLSAAGHRVVAAANPLRGLAADGEALSDLVRTIDGPVVLVGHSYGGALITNVDAEAGDIAGLVYVAGFAPEAGGSCFTLADKFPGSERAGAQRVVAIPGASHAVGVSQPRATAELILAAAALRTAEALHSWSQPRIASRSAW